MKKRGGGKIVTIGSMTSLFGFDVGPVYAASKGAVVQLTKSLAAAWAKDNIQVNSILPGFIDTDLTRNLRRNFPEAHERVVNRTPARRWGDPADLAGTAVFFCSRASDFVTGTALPVDGGFSSSMF
jgi:2-deoxy-D-gluconate 3-dehydrogenase